MLLKICEQNWISTLIDMLHPLGTGVRDSQS